MMSVRNTADSRGRCEAGRASHAWSTRLLMVMALPLVGLAAGCQQPETCLTSLPNPAVHPQITIYELANRLGLDVRQITGKGATLSNQVNSVVLPAGSSGWAYVNGKPVVRSGGVHMYAGAVWVSASLPEALQRYLVPLPALIQPPPIPWSVPKSGAMAQGFHVVIDPGHGGKDPGAISVHGTYEKTINLAVGRLLASRLRASGAQVTMTREGDTFIGLDERSAVANRVGADLFVSIHADSSGNRRAKGCTAYVCRDATDGSVRAATTIMRGMSGAGFTARGIRRANYRVLIGTRCPAVLVELGYLSNAQEASLLASGSGQERLAGSLADGLLAFTRAAG